jgi:Gas vesicle synthesis protein GvpL/GvpF
VLPVQFGSVLADRDSVISELLAPEHDRFVHQLAELEGRRQFNLRASYVADRVLVEVVQADPTIAELRRRTRGLPEGAVHPDLVRLGELVSHAIEETRNADTQAILETIEPFALDERVRPGSGVEEVVSVSVLVDDARISELEESLEVLAEAVHERIRLRLVGPVAPYDFVEAPSWA